MGYGDRREVSVLLGETLADIVDNGYELIFTLQSGRQFRMFHDRSCCERVDIEDICGDLQDLFGSPLLMAEESDSGDIPLDFEESGYESYTWTFYRFATIKGYVTIRWFGSSNGHYSESVCFEEII